MGESLFGIETEYAFSVLDASGNALERGEILDRLLALARARFAYLPDASSNGVFLQNGARLYIDAGEHPEFCTPECDNPWDVVRYVRAGERILAGLLAELVAGTSQAHRSMLLRCNVDYAGSGATWGCHESYLYRSSPDALPEEIIPHLVSRLVYTGAGGFDSLPSSTLEFTLSPRVFHLSRDISHDSTGARGVYHAKNESLSNGRYNRLHVLCGESLCSETALWLKIGTTALVVAMVDGGLSPGKDVRLRRPRDAMRLFAADPTCRAEAPAIDGRSLSAVAVQRHYLRLAREHQDAAFMPPWAGQVCDLWEEVLDRLESGAEAGSARLDWAIKLALYRERVRRRGFEWDSLCHWKHVVRSLSPALVRAGLGGFPSARVVLAPNGPLVAEVQQLTPYLERHGLAWERLDDLAALRAELFEIDTRFGEIGTGIFAAMEEAGVLSHQVSGVGNGDGALRNPPASGRAALRGRLVGELSATRGHYVCDWCGVWDMSANRRIDLSDPFATGADWQPWERRSVVLEPPSVPAALPRLAQIVLERGLRFYRRSQYAESLPHLGEAADMARATDQLAVWQNAEFWRATVLQGAGRLREASSVLEGVLASSNGGGDPSAVYRLLTRHTLVRLEMPEDLDQIEQALARAADFVRRSSRPGWGSRVLLVRARIHEARGNHALALTTAEEARALARSDPDAFSTASYSRLLVSAAIELGRFDAAHAHLEELAEIVDDSHWKAVVLTCGRSELARRERRFEEALDWGLQAVRQTSRSEDGAERVWAAGVMARAAILAGNFHRARAAASRLLPLRRNEAGHQVYSTRLLWGDYNLNRARAAAGLPVVDVESEAEQRVPRPRGPRIDPLARLAMAGIAYRGARREGRRIDAILQCDFRERALARRLELLRATRAELGRA